MNHPYITHTLYINALVLHVDISLHIITYYQAVVVQIQ